ncbi:hypothetical protein M885DRAFT_530618 [Pelagophyceae sp. CCMP2097]|nr:hypothetical protein M885DRAFT_530618 [Pelagophyceae sp. CCMP2097]
MRLRARRSSTTISTFIAGNAFATMYSVWLPPGSVGVEVKFRSDNSDPSRIEVSAVRRGVARAGVVVGDVLTTFGGRTLPPRASALELEELVCDYEEASASAAVELHLWRDERRFRFVGEADELRGYEVLIPVAAPDTVDFQQVSLPTSAAVPPQVFAVLGPRDPDHRRSSRYAALQRGLVLIGINHEPILDSFSHADLEKKLQRHAGAGIVLNLWRLTNRKVHADVIKKCSGPQASKLSFVQRLAKACSCDPLAT